MIELKNYIDNFYDYFPFSKEDPFSLIKNISTILQNSKIAQRDEYTINGTQIIHKSSVIDNTAKLEGPVFIGKNSRIGTHALLRNGTFIGEDCSIGFCCEIRQSIIIRRSTVAHFNFVGNSIIGSDVNLEAGAILCNHYNERSDRTIYMNQSGKKMIIQESKFGSIIGDGTKVGAQAVLSPGTLLLPGTVVKRLELIEQNPI